MQLVELKTYLVDAFRTNWVFVKIVSDSGDVGWGEATLEYREHTVAQAIDELARGLSGRELDNINAWFGDAYRDAYWRGGPVLTSALSAVEMALWDLKGKALGVPVHQLLGGPVRDEIPCYANAWFSGARTADDFGQAAVEAVSRGYAALKWDPFGSAFRSMSLAEIRQSLTVVDRVRDAVGDSVELIIEGHGRFDVITARRIGRELAKFDILWFEEPLIPGNIRQYVELRREIDTPVSLGERLYTKWDFRELFDLGGVDVVQPDVSHCGGISELRQIATMAELSHQWCCPHNPSGPVANAATVQLAAVMPNCPYLETMATDVPWRSELVVESCRVKDGKMTISNEPGLGIEVNEDRLADYPYQVHDLRHYQGTLTDIRPTTATFR